MERIESREQLEERFFQTVKDMQRFGVISQQQATNLYKKIKVWSYDNRKSIKIEG